MNRRGFLGLLAGVAATSVLDVEKMLWVPGRTTYSIPAPKVWSVDPSLVDPAMMIPWVEIPAGTYLAEVIMNFESIRSNQAHLPSQRDRPRSSRR